MNRGNFKAVIKMNERVSETKNELVNKWRN